MRRQKGSRGIEVSEFAWKETLLPLGRLNCAAPALRLGSLDDGVPSPEDVLYPAVARTHSHLTLVWILSLKNTHFLGFLEPIVQY